MYIHLNTSLLLRKLQFPRLSISAFCFPPDSSLPSLFENRLSAMVALNALCQLLVTPRIDPGAIPTPILNATLLWSEPPIYATLSKHPRRQWRVRQGQVISIQIFWACFIYSVSEGVAFVFHSVPTSSPGLFRLNQPPTCKFTMLRYQQLASEGHTRLGVVLLADAWPLPSILSPLEICLARPRTALW
jgi:hypothetical protein